MAQLEAIRAQQAAEAACIGLTLDEEKIPSLSAATRRHLQGLALVVQVTSSSGPGPPLLWWLSQDSNLGLLLGPEAPRYDA